MILGKIDTLKRRINDGELVVGVLGSPMMDKERLAEVLDADEYGFVSIDSQHSPFSEERLVEFCGVAEELGIPVHFRIKHTRHTYLIGNLLDLGPAMIEVPQVEDESTVEEALRYFYYPQLGRRSWGGAARVAIGDHPDRVEYANWWNAHGVLWMQIESLHSVTEARRFAKPGVDCLSWGPADLTFDREGHPGHPFQTDDDCVEHVARVLNGSGTRLCIRSYDPALRSKYADMGATVLVERPKV